MADIVSTSTRIGAVFPQQARIVDMIAAETIVAGQAVYQTSAGKAGLADANSSGKEQFRGIALTGGGAGQAISVLAEGHVYGFTLSGLAYDALAYLSDTAGALADAAATLTVRCGRVVPLTDGGSLTKVLYIKADWLNNWA